jgi:hypothetical protein
MSHNKIFNDFVKPLYKIVIKHVNQRYKLLITNPKDIFVTAIYQNTADFVYSASRTWE